MILDIIMFVVVGCSSACGVFMASHIFSVLSYEANEAVEPKLRAPKVQQPAPAQDDFQHEAEVEVDNLVKTWNS